MRRRPRGRPLVALKRRLTDSASGREARFRERLTDLEPLEAIPFERAVAPPPLTAGSVTRRFAAQLGDWQPDLAALPGDARAAWDAAGEEERTYLRVMFAVWQDAPGFCECSGLLPADPPEHVHAMARGPLAAGGGLNAADVVADALEAAGVRPSGARRALDFGGSSGRVVRVLQAAFPEIEWHSCDPNADAIAWAAEHLPAVGFHVSPQEPPLPFPEAHFDVVYAISVWSHFAEAAALRWFEEMHRIIRPGGVLVPTVQSWQTTHHLAAHQLWNVRDVRRAIANLYRSGHHYQSVFGPGGDFGVESESWGFAILSAEWLSRKLTPAWEVVLWRPGALEANQDVVVLRRR
jgi:SAM-dependent methyltransferase